MKVTQAALHAVYTGHAVAGIPWSDPWHRDHRKRAGCGLNHGANRHYGRTP